MGPFQGLSGPFWGQSGPIPLHLSARSLPNDNKISENKICKISKFYCHGFSQEKQCFGTIFRKFSPPQPPPKTQILLILSFRRLCTSQPRGKSRNCRQRPALAQLAPFRLSPRLPSLNSQILHEDPKDPPVQRRKNRGRVNRELTTPPHPQSRQTPAPSHPRDFGPFWARFGPIRSVLGELEGPKTVKCNP